MGHVSNQMGKHYTEIEWLTGVELLQTAKKALCLRHPFVHPTNDILLATTLRGQQLLLHRWNNSKIGQDPKEQKTMILSEVWRRLKRRSLLVIVGCDTRGRFLFFNF